VVVVPKHDGNEHGHAAHEATDSPPPSKAAPKEDRTQALRDLAVRTARASTLPNVRADACTGGHGGRTDQGLVLGSHAGADALLRLGRSRR
jgi:hypothetical protein